MAAEGNRHRVARAGPARRGEAVYRAILVQDPSFFHALHGLAYIARARGDREAALALFRQLAATNPRDVWMQKEIGSELRELGRLDEAEAVYRAILVEDSSFFHAHHGLAYIARARGDHEAALELFRQLATKNPRDVWKQKEIATELRELGRLDEAEAMLPRHPGRGSVLPSCSS